jgi:hypothetical protein
MLETSISLAESSKKDLFQVNLRWKEDVIRILNLRRTKGRRGLVMAIEQASACASDSSKRLPRNVFFDPVRVRDSLPNIGADVEVFRLL